MARQIRLFLIAAALCLNSTGAERATIHGRVLDEAGRPVERATVLVYAAGVKTGYSTHCPTCYVDCGKRTATGASGGYTIAGLDGELWFRLLVVRDGYAPEFVMRVDPVAGPTEDVKLKARAPSAAGYAVRGRVVDSHGLPLRDAVVKPEGIATQKGPARYRYDGDLRAADTIAVTDPKGEFELVSTKTALAMVLLVEARGMAPKRFRDVLTGPERTSLTVTDGAMVHGRVMRNGAPVGGVELGLLTQSRLSGSDFGEIRIGTDTEGRFTIPNVPAPQNYYLYGKMESLTGRGTIAARKIDAAADGDDIDAGDLAVVPGLRLSGHVVLSDGKQIPPGMRISIGSACFYCDLEKPVPFAGGTTLDRGYQLSNGKTAMLGPDGRFEFTDLPPGPLQVSAAVQGYALQPGTKILTPPDMDRVDIEWWKFAGEAAVKTLEINNVVEVRLERDVDDFVIRLEPKGKQ